MAKRSARLPSTPDEEWNKAEIDVDETLKQIRQIQQAIDDLTSAEWKKCFKFLSSVSRTLEGMEKSVADNRRVTEKMQKAIDNIGKAVYDLSDKEIDT